MLRMQRVNGKYLLHMDRLQIDTIFHLVCRLISQLSINMLIYLQDFYFLRIYSERAFLDPLG
jgi:hypothetical protein